MLFQHEKAKPLHLENAETAHALCLLLCFSPSNYSPVVVPNAVAQKTLREPQCLGVQMGFAPVWQLRRSHPKEFPGEAGTGIPAWAALTPHGLGVQVSALGELPLVTAVVGRWEHGREHLFVALKCISKVTGGRNQSAEALFGG